MNTDKAKTKISHCLLLIRVHPRSSVAIPPFSASVAISSAVRDNCSMLTSYLRAAMHQARYEIVEDDGSFYGEIPAIRGIWANAQTLEACREELESVLEGWVLLSIADHSPIPEIDGNRLEIREVA
jgi:predicted RNase H-like HicB family nuclease